MPKKMSNMHFIPIAKSLSKLESILSGIPIKTYKAWLDQSALSILKSRSKELRVLDAALRKFYQHRDEILFVLSEFNLGDVVDREGLLNACDSLVLSAQDVLEKIELWQKEKPHQLNEKDEKLEVKSGRKAAIDLLTDMLFNLLDRRKPFIHYYAAADEYFANHNLHEMETLISKNIDELALCRARAKIKQSQIALGNMQIMKEEVEEKIYFLKEIETNALEKPAKETPLLIKLLHQEQAIFFNQLNIVNAALTTFQIASPNVLAINQQSNVNLFQPQAIVLPSSQISLNNASTSSSPSGDKISASSPPSLDKASASPSLDKASTSPSLDKASTSPSLDKADASSPPFSVKRSSSLSLKKLDPSSVLLSKKESKAFEKPSLKKAKSVSWGKVFFEKEPANSVTIDQDLKRRVGSPKKKAKKPTL